MRNINSILEKAERIGIVRTDHLGDMILTLPMCSALKEIYNRAKVTVIARKYVKPILTGIDEIDGAIFIDDFENGITDIFKRYKYDVVFFPRPVFKEVLSAFINGVPMRIGSAYRWYSALFNHRIYEHRKVSLKHEAEYNVSMVELAGGRKLETKLIKLTIDDDSRNRIAKLKRDMLKGAGRKYIIIHPGSGGSAYEWKAEYFGRAANAISQVSGYDVLISGIESESVKCMEANEYCPSAINICGKLSLSEFIALIDGASLLIANSTGAIHIAAAQGVPVLGLYPNTSHLSAARWGPYSSNSVVLSPTLIKGDKSSDDLNTISVEEVSDAGLMMLSGNSGIQ